MQCTITATKWKKLIKCCLLQWKIINIRWTITYFLKYRNKGFLCSYSAVVLTSQYPFRTPGTRVRIVLQELQFSVLPCQSDGYSLQALKHFGRGNKHPSSPLMTLLHIYHAQCSGLSTCHLPCCSKRSTEQFSLRMIFSCHVWTAGMC